MNKKSVLWILLDLVFIVIFNTVFFLVSGFEHIASVWISYGFIHFSYLCVIATPFLVRKSSSSSIFGISICSVSSAYFFIELIAGTIFIIINTDSYKAPLAIQIIIAGIYLIVLISTLIANETTADNSELHENEVAFIKQASSKTKLLINKVNSKKAKKEVEKVYDALHASPAKSNNSVNSVEQEIRENIDELKYDIDNNDENSVVNRTKLILSLIEERNAVLRNTY